MDDNKILLQKDTMSEVSRDEILSSNMSCEFSVRWDEESACDTGDGVVAVLATNNSTNTSEDIVTTFDEGTIELQLVSRSTSIDYKASGELIDIDFGKKYIHDGTIEKSNENFSMDGPKRKAGFQSIPKFRFSNSNIFRSAASRLETTLNDKNLNFARRKPFKSMKQFPGNNNQSTTDLPGNLFKGFREALSIPIGDHDSHQKFNEQEVQRKKPKRIDTPLKFQTQKEYPHKELQLKQQKQNEKPRVQKTQHFQHKNLVEKQVIRKEHSPEKEQITQKERHFKREQEGQADTLYKPAHVQQQQIKTPRMHIPSIERGSNVPINHIHPVSTINQPNLYRQRRVIRFPSAHALPEEAQFKRIISTDDTSNTCIHLDESSKGDFSRDETSLESVKEVVILAPKTQAISPETVLTMETFETVEEASTNYMEIQSRNYKEVQPSYQSHTRTEKEFRNPPPSVERRTRRRDRRSSVHREPVSVVSSVVSTASSYSTIDVRSDGPSVGPSVDTNRTLSTDVSDGMSITSRATRVTQSSMVTHNTRTYQSGGLAYRKRNGRWTVSANQETEPKMTSYGGIADKYLDFIYDYFVDE
uniref:Uncharacterized protein n=1 Tax=Corethron hystrix TaxID=216773 RepID=A0A7S1BN18_9STRA|mmetsp:Transcript_34636/g.80072  ORF Transcript_34636/g.80072 Transcript_34636/m.80072 type:complete len:587 (+) Transcript_34636:326-2086(+)